MPNGHGEYNSELCKEKHERLDQDIKQIKNDSQKEFNSVWQKIKETNDRIDDLWKLIVGSIGVGLLNLGGVAILIIISYFSGSS